MLNDVPNHPSARRRPHSLREVAEWTLAGKCPLEPALREFLDTFYTAESTLDRAAMLQEEPPLLPKDTANAYLGAVAEHLCRRYRLLPIPAWTAKPERFLHEPWFPIGLESLKATLLVESPVAFRRRMIFVEADPLYRPRRDTPRFGVESNDDDAE